MNFLNLYAFISLVQAATDSSSPAPMVQSNSTIHEFNNIPNQKCSPPRQNWATCEKVCVKRDCDENTGGRVVCSCAEWQDKIIKPVTCDQPVFGECISGLGLGGIAASCSGGIWNPILDGACATYLAIAAVEEKLDELSFRVQNTLGIGEEGKKDKLHQQISSNNPHGSFAPQRTQGNVKWYVDGKDYLYSISEALLSAKSEICIEDWWLSPEVYLRRPPAENEDFRLDRILQRKANEGVKIYVVVYEEVPQALTLNSEHTKKSLEALHPTNIIVQRHPDHAHVLESTEFWAHHEKICIIDRRLAFIGGLDLCYGRWDTSNHDVTDALPLPYFIGQDYSNPRIKDFEDVQEYSRTLIDRNELTRMPWHDISIGMTGEPVADVVAHFTERWNFIREVKYQHEENHHNLPLPEFELGNFPEYKMHCQVLRSSSEWSHGIPTERSIQNAYIEQISNSEHFIYIENQFFITCNTDDPDYKIKNLIGKALVERIIRAHNENTPFQVIVSMPLIPAFPAELSTKEAESARLIMAWQYDSISRGGKSIYDLLRQANIDPRQYINFYSLRTRGRIQSCTDALRSHVSELLYIHTKLMIVDDRSVIIGSANLNDRSQCGSRDSEIAMLIQDSTMINSTMNGQHYSVSKFASTLRRHIFQEHLGLIKHEKNTRNVVKNMQLPHFENEYQFGDHGDLAVVDPLSAQFKQKWTETAKTNTQIYRKLFHSVPDDTLTTWDEYNAFFDKTPENYGHVHSSVDLATVEKEVVGIHGHLVEFPIDFLNRVDLMKESLSSKLAMDLFT
ncbi:hypothetical protein HDV01_006963 [Terramyces sp. JEL0728]|nr:hypothetical protein HDV01_006963 [Terramyces sp. JEL0728]